MSRHESKKKTSTIRALEFHAKRDSVKALIQLAEYYKDGRYVEKNTDLAKIYQERALELFQKQSLKVSSVKLIDFRVFKELDVDFCNNFQRINNYNITVIVGNNGSGKTTILEAIVLSLNWITNRIISKNGNARQIDIMDINNRNKVEYSSIITKLSVLNDLQYEAELSRAKKGSNTSRRSNLEDITQLALLYRLAHENNECTNFPIMAYYSVKRAVEIDKNDFSLFDETTVSESLSKFFGYSNALNGSTDFKWFFRTFKYLDDIQNSVTKKDQYLVNEVEKIKDQLALLEKVKKEIGEESSSTNIILSQKIELTNKLDNLNNQLSDKHGLQFNKYIKYVSNAIYKFLSDFENLRIQRIPHLDMLIDKRGATLSVLQMSQGERSLMALIADIAQRLVLLNPSLDDPLEGSGVVLIDEIDLHLHPEWQQSIIPNLTRAFPNIQFIVTTHSPQVLSTVPRECIRILSQNIQGRSVAAIPQAYSYGEPSNDVMHAIMHVDPQPPVPEKKLLDELTSMVDQDEYESPRFQKILLELKSTLSENHPQIERIERNIRRHQAFKK